MKEYYNYLLKLNLVSLWRIDIIDRLLKKLQNTPAIEIKNTRIRVPNYKKIGLLTRSYVKYQLNLVRLIMTTLFWILIFLTTFCIMEFMAWFTHKYIMHGFLWKLP